jgi:septum formation protein
MAFKVCLVSGSPRRKALLEALGWDVQVRVSHADETWPSGVSVEEAVVQVACRKWEGVEQEAIPTLVADTVVYFQGQVLGKPADAQEAHRMLRVLSAQEHAVYTGFAVRYQGVVRTGVVCTRVCFRPLSDEEITRYIVLEKPFDKAGAYGIQEGGGHFVRWIEGSYTNVMGLPLYEVQQAVGSLK